MILGLVIYTPPPCSRQDRSALFFIEKKPNPPGGINPPTLGTKLKLTEKNIKKARLVDYTALTQKGCHLSRQKLAGSHDRKLDLIEIILALGICLELIF